MVPQSPMEQGFLQSWPKRGWMGLNLVQQAEGVGLAAGPCVGATQEAGGEIRRGATSENL